MQTFLKVLGFITIFIGIFAGIYVIADALSMYAGLKTAPNTYTEQVYLIKVIAGGAIILSSVVSGMLYLSFGIVIELLDNMNHKLVQFLDSIKINKAKEETTEEFKF